MRVVIHESEFFAKYLSPEAVAVLRMLLEFHVMNDEAEEGYYNQAAFEELCEAFGVELPTEVTSMS